MTDKQFNTPEEALAHYGVKGMKWGVVKEQQRVISTADHLKNSTEYKKGVVESAKFLKTYADRQGLESGDFNRRYVLAKAFLEGKEHSFKTNPSLAGDKDVDALMRDVVKQINPDFGKPGTKMNCRRCTFAYEMRRRGLDVKPTLTTNASGQHIVGLQNALTPGQDKATRGSAFIKEANQLIRSGVNMWGAQNISEPNFDWKVERANLKREAKKNGTKTNWFKRNAQSAEMFHERRATKVFDELAKQGDGARGELGLAWMMGGGHSVAYEVVKGKAVVFDTQSGKKYDNNKDMTDLIGFAGQIAYTRFDNLPLNEDYLRRWVQDA